MRVARSSLMLLLAIMALQLTGGLLAPRYGAPARAGEYVGVEVGTSEEILPNSAIHQPKHYLKQDADLLGRIAALMRDVDCLLERLHALPPELDGNTMLNYPADAELAGLFVLALDHNPELKPLRSELAVLAARTRQEGAKQDPMFGFGFEDYPTPLPLLTHNAESGWFVSLSQEFEGYGKRGLKREIAHWDEILKERELEKMELELLLELTEKYYDLHGTEARLRSLNQNIQLMDVLIELASRKFAIGTTPQAAVLAAQVQLGTMEAMRIELTNLRDQQRVRLNEKLGQPTEFDPASLRFDAPYPLPVEVNWDNEELLAHGLDHRPDYQLLLAELEQQDLQLEMAYRGYRPDYSLRAEYKVGQGKQDSIMAMVEIPLFTHKEERQDAQVQEAYAMQAVTTDELESVANAYLSKLLDLQLELRMHGQLVDLYRKALVPQARLNLDSNIAAYSAGMMDLSDLIMAQQALLVQEQELEQNYIHILHTLTDLQLVTGGAFDPEPYLTPSDDALGKSARSPLDSANNALAEEALRELNQGQSPAQLPQGPLPPVPADLFREEAPLPPGNGFIDSLKLPEPQPEATPESASIDDSGFYEPWTPEGDSEPEVEPTDDEASKGEADD